MKKIVCIAVLCTLAGWVFAQKKGATMWIAVKSAPLKTGTGYFSGTAGTLAYGDEVKVLAVDGSKVQVQSTAKTSLSGWTDKNNLSSKKVVAQGNTNSASAKELALAGKGFTDEVEASYKTDNANLNYAAVDALEKVKIADKDELAFIQDGHLKGAE